MQSKITERRKVVLDDENVFLNMLNFVLYCNQIVKSGLKHRIDESVDFHRKKNV